MVEADTCLTAWSVEVSPSRETGMEGGGGRVGLRRQKQAPAGLTWGKATDNGSRSFEFSDDQPVDSFLRRLTCVTLAWKGKCHHSGALYQIRR